MIRSLLVAAVSAVVVSPAMAGTVIVKPDPTSGDSFTNSGVTNQGEAVGANGAGWYYNNVRRDGVVGITNALPRSGTGSVAQGGPNNAKGDIEFLPNAVNVGGNFFSTGSLGKLKDLNALSYDWYRDASSTAGSHFHSSLRLLLDLDGDLTTLTDRGGIVFERAYNPSVSPVPTDTWVSEDVFAADANMWSFGLGKTPQQDGYDVNLSEWMAGSGLLGSANAAVIGISSGIGSGWDTYSGAVDNIRFGFGTTEATTYNFEVDGGTVIPTPAAAGAGLFLLGSMALRRRQNVLD